MLCINHHNYQNPFLQPYLTSLPLPRKKYAFA